MGMTILSITIGIAFTAWTECNLSVNDVSHFYVTRLFLGKSWITIFFISIFSAQIIARLELHGVS